MSSCAAPLCLDRFLLCSLLPSSEELENRLLEKVETTLFIYFWLCWVFIAARGLSLAEVSGGYSSLWCAGFSLQWLLFVAEHGI